MATGRCTSGRAIGAVDLGGGEWPRRLGARAVAGDGVVAARRRSEAASPAGLRGGRGRAGGRSAVGGGFFGKRSAQRASASGGERDWSGNRSEAEIGAESPSAKRLAQKLKWACLGRKGVHGGRAGECGGCRLPGKPVRNGGKGGDGPEGERQVPVEAEGAVAERKGEGGRRRQERGTESKCAGRRGNARRWWERHGDRPAGIAGWNGGTEERRSGGAEEREEDEKQGMGRTAERSGPCLAVVGGGSPS